MAILGGISFSSFALILLTGLAVDPVEPSWKGWDADSPLDWWQDTIVYQIYPSSFQDSDGDGVGDLKGIESRLDHFVDAGVKTFWLSPVFKSPMADLGYDVSDFKDIDPTFGTLQDFKDLVKAVKAKGLRIVIDFVPNHTSDEHDWFQQSIKRIDPYTDYYIWRDGRTLPNGTVVEPNNWLSLFGGPGWQYVEERGQYYYHLFNVKQPDLNHRNGNVSQEMKDTMRFWLDIGVDGFRVDAVKYIFEDESFADEAYYDPNGSRTSYFNLIHNLTMDIPDTYNLMYQWREFLDEYRSQSPDKHTRAMLTEAYMRVHEVDKVMRYYQHNETVLGAHFTFNFFLVMYLNHASNASVFDWIVRQWTDNLPDGGWPNWVIGNHDNHRVATKFGQEMVDGMNMMSMLLPGTAVTYQGEEIGQPDTLLRADQVRDPNNNGNGVRDIRDAERGPFLWDSSENAGFSSRKRTWEPVHPSYWRLNLERQKVETPSHYSVYKQIAQLRRHPTIQRGTFETHVVSTWVFTFVRRLRGNDTIVVVMNLGSEQEIIVLSQEISNLPENMTVAVASINSAYKIGDIIHPGLSTSGTSNLLVLRPKAAVVLKGQSPNQGNSTGGHNSTAAYPTIFKPLLLLVATLPIFMRR